MTTYIFSTTILLVSTEPGKFLILTDINFYITNPNVTMKTQYQYFCNSTITKEKKLFYKHTLRYNTTQSHPLPYLTPDYFLPASCSESYYSKKYVGNSNLNLKSKSSKIARVASTILLSLSFLATALEVKAQPNLGAPIPTSSFALQSPHQHVNFQSSQQQPKKKPLLKRAAHKVAKRLGFSNSSLKSQAYGTSVFDQPHSSSQSNSLYQPSISYDEVKAIYESEYGESIDEAMSKRVERNETVADILRRTLDIRERELAKRELTNTLDTFSDTASVSGSSGISEMSSDSNSGNSDSATDEHIWQDPDIEIERVFTYEFSSRVDQMLDTSSGYSGSDTASNSDISSPDAGSINESFNFTPSSDDPEYSDTAQDEFNNIHDTILTDVPNETFATSHNTQNLEWDTEWDDSDDSDDDTSSIYTSSSEYSDTDSEYPNSDSEYDLNSEQVSLNEFEVVDEGRNFDTAVTRTQENAPVITVVLATEVK